MIDLSVITINWNDAKGLARTRESLKHLISNDFQFEWIVIDGASVDNSLAEAKIRVEGASKIVVKSESDDGIYFAMNKGIALSSGKYSIFMNSGDCFLVGACDLLDSFFKDGYGSIDVKVFGVRSLSGDQIVDTRKFSSPKQLRKSPAVPHQSTLIRTEALVASGGYNLDYRLLSDYDLFCRFFCNGKIFDYTDKRELAIFEQGGSSSVAKNQLLVAREAFAIQRKYFKRINIMYGFSLGVKYLLLRSKLLGRLERIIRVFFFGGDKSDLKN